MKDTELMDTLTTEYMKLCEEGNFWALDFALQESDEYNICVQSTIANLMRIIDGDLIAIAHWAMSARRIHLEALEKVAPRWAVREYPSRVAELQAAEDSSAEVL